MKKLNALNTLPGIGCKKLKMLINHFGSSDDIWRANLSELINSGIGEASANKIIEMRPLLNPDLEWEKLERENIMVFNVDDNEYPKLLKQIPDHPYLIYMRGDLSCLDFPLIAVIGSRKLTNYGIQATSSLSRDLAKNQICVVSGLAFGVDACAHNGALCAHGKTIAVLGNSLDNESIAPRSNFNLAQDILKAGGLLISEFPIITRACKGTFPARNRIMAGMSLGTLVIEAAEKSGTLITANLALDYNREVFCVPGSIFSPQSTGTHKLIKAGAKLTCSVSDILEELRLNHPTVMEEKSFTVVLSNEEEKVYNVLSHESLHIDIIIKLTKLDTSTISSILAILEIKGAIKNVGGQNYIRL